MTDLAFREWLEARVLDSKRIAVVGETYRHAHHMVVSALGTEGIHAKRAASFTHAKGAQIFFISDEDPVAIGGKEFDAAWGHHVTKTTEANLLQALRTNDAVTRSHVVVASVVEPKASPARAETPKHKSPLAAQTIAIVGDEVVLQVGGLEARMAAGAARQLGERLVAMANIVEPQKVMRSGAT